MQPETTDEPQCGGYNPGHPWYYLLGGDVLPPKAIMRAATRRGYRGYLAGEIERIDRLSEPKRSHLLHAMKEKALADYRSDLWRYRALAVKLHRDRRDNGENQAPCCGDIHVAMSLKHNHLYNDLAHLTELDRLLTKQRDLFDF